MFRILASPNAALLWGLACAVVIFVQSWIYLRLKSSFNSWREVEAEVLESRINSYTDMDGNFVREPIVRFKYKIDGAEYISETPYLRSFTLASKFRDISEDATHFQEGQIVSARAHPDFPDISYIAVAKFDLKSIYLAVILIAFIGFGSYFLSNFLGFGT